MFDRIKSAILAFIMIVASTAPLLAQQKGQWVPGQTGLNAGVLPDAGLTYANLTINYSADTLNDANGNATRVTGTYSFWAIENVLYYVPQRKILGGKLAFMITMTPANGSLTAP